MVEVIGNSENKPLGFNRVDLWEHTERWDTRGTQHPNSEGYRLLSDEFYKFIDTQKII